MNVTEAQDVVVLLRVLQGLHKPTGGPYPVDDVVAVCERLAGRAAKPLLCGIPVSRSAVVQTLDHLAELDDDQDPDVEVVYVPTVAPGTTTRVVTT